MSIFQEFGGRSSYYTANELDRLQNPEKYNYDQAQYDAFAAQAQKKADSRQAALEASQDAIPYSYVGRGTGATNPAFSFAGYSGQTSGGTSGLSGFGGLAGLFGGGSTTETTGSTTSSDGGGGGGGGGGPRDDQGNVQQRAEGGVITSPYANPMKMQMGQVRTMEARLPEPGIGGMFESLQQQFGQQMNQMRSSPLRVYTDYLNQTYVGPQAQEMQGKVEEFVDLVDQAERAHFGAEESFGYGRPMQPPMMQNHRAVMTEMPLMQTQGPELMTSGIASLPPAF